MKNREDILNFYKKLITPTLARRQGLGRMDFGYSGSHYDRNQIEIEGFLRLLWGVSPKNCMDYCEQEFSYYKESIVAGTDRNSDCYWGDVEDYDQLLVEMASLAVALVITRENFFDKLTQDEKTNIHAWLNQINNLKVHKNNWTFFRILVNMAFKVLSLGYSQVNLDLDLELIEGMYLDNGWYMDGNVNQMDYYIPWAMHFYSLIYIAFSKVCNHTDDYTEKFTKRAEIFAKDFIYWFDCSGAGVPFGRSLTYRFAQGAYFAALAFADVEALPWGECKHLLLKHLEYWDSHSITRADGTLSIGYLYENYLISESYNAPGSPYWAFKIFLILAVDKNHKIFTSEAKAPTKSLHKKLIKEAKMIVTNEVDGSSQIYLADQYTNQTRAGEKYSKFVYSSTFGFSVSRDRLGLRACAYDNALGVSLKGSDFFVSKERVSEYEVNENYTYTLWKPYKGVSIKSYIVPLEMGHIRVHKISTDKALTLADGGYSSQIANSHSWDYEYTKLSNENSFCMIFRGENGTAVSVSLSGYDFSKSEVIFTEPNTNILYPNSALPSLITDIEVGEHVLVSYHFATISEVCFDFSNAKNREIETEIKEAAAGVKRSAKINNYEVSDIQKFLGISNKIVIEKDCIVVYNNSNIICRL